MAKAISWALLILLVALSAALPPHEKCEPITIGLCNDMPYNQTIMPNLLNQQNQEDAALEAHQFMPLFKVNCSPDFKLFACSVYAPACNNLGIPVPPCRSLCLSAKSGCENLMNRFGFAWPETFNCAKFPTPEIGEYCFGKTERPQT